MSDKQASTLETHSFKHSHSNIKLTANLKAIRMYFFAKIPMVSFLGRSASTWTTPFQLIKPKNTQKTTTPETSSVRIDLLLVYSVKARTKLVPNLLTVLRIESEVNLN